ARRSSHRSCRSSSATTGRRHSCGRPSTTAASTRTSPCTRRSSGAVRCCGPASWPRTSGSTWTGRSRCSTAAEECSKSPSDLGALPRELPPGESQHLVALELQIQVALVVSLEGAAGAVEAPAVELDDHDRTAPVGIDLVALDDCVHHGQRQLLVATEVHQEVFEVCLGVRRN